MRHGKTWVGTIGMELFGYPLLQNDGGDFDLVLHICELTRLPQLLLAGKKGKVA